MMFFTVLVDALLWA